MCTEETHSLCPFSVLIKVPSGKLHNLMVLSALAEASSFPSGLMCTEEMIFLCPSNVLIKAPSDRLHNLMVSSKLAETNSFPSGLIRTEEMGSSCASNVAGALLPTAFSPAALAMVAKLLRNTSITAAMMPAPMKARRFSALLVDGWAPNITVSVGSHSQFSLTRERGKADLLSLECFIVVVLCFSFSGFCWREKDDDFRRREWQASTRRQLRCAVEERVLGEFANGVKTS